MNCEEGGRPIDKHSVFPWAHSPLKSNVLSLPHYVSFQAILAQVAWASARVGVYRLFPFAIHISVFFHSLLTCHWISSVFLLYDRRICTHVVDPSLTHFLGEFPDLGLALVPLYYSPPRFSRLLRHEVGYSGTILSQNPQGMNTDAHEIIRCTMRVLVF